MSGFCRTVSCSFFRTSDFPDFPDFPDFSDFPDFPDFFHQSNRPSFPNVRPREVFLDGQESDKR